MSEIAVTEVEMGLRAECNCLRRQVDELQKENTTLRKKVTANQEVMTSLKNGAGYIQWLIKHLEEQNG